MFGGICFLLHGNMCCGVIGSDMIVRIAPDHLASVLREKHTRIFNFTGRPSRSMVYVGKKAVQTDDALKRWLQVSLDVVKSLPPKT